MYLLLMRVRILKKKSTSCCKYVPTAVRTYLLHLPGIRASTNVRTHLLHILLFLLVHAYVPTVRTALTNAISTHILNKTAVPNLRTYCFTYRWWCTYLSTAVRTSYTYCKYLLMTYVRT